MKQELIHFLIGHIERYARKINDGHRNICLVPDGYKWRSGWLCLYKGRQTNIQVVQPSENTSLLSWKCDSLIRGSSKKQKERR